MILFLIALLLAPPIGDSPLPPVDDLGAPHPVLIPDLPKVTYTAYIAIEGACGYVNLTEELSGMDSEWLAFLNETNLTA